MSDTATRRLETLDAMRGVAALLVVFFHFGALAPGLSASGYLAVDFFFVLSGFVIAQAYDTRLAGGMKIATFIERRIIRLYPLYLIGLLLGAAVALARVVMHDDHALTLNALIAPLALGAFMLPSSVGVSTEDFPLNGPEWSLFFEVVANLLYGAFALSLGKRGLIALVLVTAIALGACEIARGNIDMGSDWGTLVGGFLRLLFSFSVGMLISRWRLTPRAGPSWLALAPVALLAVALAGAPPVGWRAAYDLAFALAVSPLLVIFGARFEPPALLRPAARLLGEISYPLYAIHFPLIFVAGFIAHKLGITPAIWLPLFVVAVTLSALAASRLLDQPVRAWITARRRAGAAHPAPGEA